MGTTDIALERVFRQLLNGNAGLVINEVDTYLSAWPNPQSKEKLDILKQEYQLMTGYWQQGMKDPQREAQYQRLLQRLYVLCANISIHRHIEGSSFLQMLYSQVRQSGYVWSLDDIRKEMEDFVSDIAMLEFEPEQQRKEKSKTLYLHHQKKMNALFNYILTSRLWTESVGQDMKELLLSPTVDVIDQQLVISAITLSLMNRFDIVKFHVLLNVYQQSQDEEVRQHALVGWVFGIDDDFLPVYPELHSMMAELLQSEHVCQELTELQMQLVYSLNAERDTSTIQKEIWPDLLKSSSLKITRDGIKEEEDELENILHPDAEEQRMEKLEASMQRMMDMQKQGVDIYFGGFSQMKRFPFFYDISNWLVPFYLQHPDISQYMEKLGSLAFLETLLKKGPFCDSDKYSLVIAFHQTYSNLPASMKDLLSRNELAGVDPSLMEEEHTATYIRRMYLMNLYRFFRLFPNRSSLCNPFDTSRQELGMCLFFTSELFRRTPLEQQKRKVMVLLRKKQFHKTASLLLDTFPDEMHDVQYYLWRQSYAEALDLDPNNVLALVGHARQCYENGDYDESLADYDKLLLLRPDRENYLLNKAVCLVQMGEYDTAQQLLFQLNYKHPDDDSVKRALAWALTCDGKLQQALVFYDQLMGIEHPESDDYLNRGYCLWLLGNISEAAMSFRIYVREANYTLDQHVLFTETALLKRAGITDVEIKMMETMVLS